MMIAYQQFFAFQKEPFRQDIPVSEIFPLPRLKPLVERFHYVIRLAAVGVITGEIGSGKSTSLRYAASGLHPSEFKILALTAHSGTLKECLKQILLALDTECFTNSITVLLKTLRSMITEFVTRKQMPVLVIDEAHLLRTEVLAYLHIVGQLEFDSKSMLPIILSGQNQLLDKLHASQARAFASRVVGRTHLEALQLEDMKAYLKHHLDIAGMTKQLFSEEAILAIHQGSGGLLRRANILARGALVAAAAERTQLVAAEHVRVAATEVV